MSELTIRNLKARIGDKEILRGVDLSIKSGEIHVLMGMNGSGKSTLASALMGRPDIIITEGSALLDQIDLLSLPPEKRARAGLFLGFQHPVAIPGVTLSQCMRVSVRSICESRGTAFDSKKFSARLHDITRALDVPAEFAQRALNDGFSGGEKKRAEIMQMKLAEPKFALLDEIDSGVDVDALKLIARSIQEEVASRGLGALLITHYTHVLKHVSPRAVHVFKDGRIVRSGGYELAHVIEENGYESISN